MKRILLPLVATIVIYAILQLTRLRIELYSFFNSIGINFKSLYVVDIIQVVIAVGIYFGIYFIVKKRRATNHQNSLNELKKNDDITKNGVVVNAADMTEQYSVKKCPSCAEEINKEAIKCKHCGEGVGKGYEIIADGTYVAKKIQGERTESKQSGNLFFMVVWITLTVLVVILLFNAAILTAFFASIFG